MYKNVRFWTFMWEDNILLKEKCSFIIYNTFFGDEMIYIKIKWIIKKMTVVCSKNTSIDLVCWTWSTIDTLIIKLLSSNDNLICYII